MLAPFIKIGKLGWRGEELTFVEFEIPIRHPSGAIKLAEGSEMKILILDSWYIDVKIERLNEITQ